MFSLYFGLESISFAYLTQLLEVLKMPLFYSEAKYSCLQEALGLQPILLTRNILQIEYKYQGIIYWRSHFRNAKYLQLEGIIQASCSSENPRSSWAFLTDLCESWGVGPLAHMTTRASEWWGYFSNWGVACICCTLNSVSLVSWESVYLGLAFPCLRLLSAIQLSSSVICHYFAGPRRVLQGADGSV